MRGLRRTLLVPALALAVAAPAAAQHANARTTYETGAMGRLGDCMADGMIAGAAAGVVYGMFRTDRSDLRTPSMLVWGLAGVGMGILPGMAYWAMHEVRRDRALKRERPDQVTTPGPRVEAKILLTRPCRGPLPFTSGPAAPATARGATLSWVREP